jgi:hypothetical protein
MNDVFPVGECCHGLEFFVRKPDRKFSSFHDFVFMTKSPGENISGQIADRLMNLGPGKPNVGQKINNIRN